VEKEPTIQNTFRKLEVDLPPIRQENNLFWWLAGIALALCVLALTLHYYVLDKQHKPPPAQKLVVQQTAHFIKKPHFRRALYF